MNKVMLTGRITKPPELKYTPANKAVVKFSVAVQGFKKDHVDYINCVAWEKTAEYIYKYIQKGDKMVVEGRLTNYHYEKDGGKVYVTEVICDNVENLSYKKSEDKLEQIPLTDFDNVGGNEELPF